MFSGKLKQMEHLTAQNVVSATRSPLKQSNKDRKMTFDEVDKYRGLMGVVFVTKQP